MTVCKDPVRIYVGTDRTQLIGYEVLKYSIERHSSLPVVMQPMLDLNLPEPKDKRQAQRTGFSFSRFAIPRLAGFRGRALYMDADMQVFADIAELWRTPLNGSKVAVQEEIPKQHEVACDAGKTRKRVKQCSVMLLDCAALRWIPEDIIAGLDGQYSYSELMSDLCILAEHEVSYAIPFKWNSLEHWDEHTCLIHYTDMNTQPWVSNANPFGRLWVEELRRMLNDGSISWARVATEIRRGYARPSLKWELDKFDCPIDQCERRAHCDEIDNNAGFEMHREVRDAQRRRRVAQRPGGESPDGGSRTGIASFLAVLFSKLRRP